MQDPASELRRILLLSTSVNKAKRVSQSTSRELRTRPSWSPQRETLPLRNHPRASGGEYTWSVGIRPV